MPNVLFRSPPHCQWVYLSSNGDLNLNTGLDVDDDLLDDLGGGVEAAKKVASVYWSCEPADRGKCGGICLTR